MTLRLPFDYQIVTDLTMTTLSGNSQRFVSVWLPRDGRYATFCVDRDGNCYWGHYMIPTGALANHDLMQRSGLTRDYTLVELLEKTNRKELA